MRQKDQIYVYIRETLDELAAAGMLEVVRIREDGEPVYRKVAELDFAKAKAQRKQH